MFDRIARRLRPHELGHDGRDAPPLARARGRPGAGRAGRSARSTWPRAPATWRSSCATRRRRGGRARTSPRRCSSSRAPRRPRSPSSRATRWSCPIADDSFDAATVGFGARNFSDLGRGLARDGARGAAGRARGGARDHHAAAAAAVVVLPALVRPGGARARPARRRPRRLRLPAELRAALPRAAGAGRRRWPPPACATSAGSSPPAGSSPSTPGRCA